MKLKNKIAIVTGGAMGNGKGIAEVFLRYGAQVIILDYAQEIQQTIEEFTNQGFPVTGYQVDIRNQEDVNKCIEKVKELYGRVDILVNNAGVCKLVPFKEMTERDRDYHFDINIKGTWNVTKAVVPLMPKESSIINLSSVTGVKVADPGETAYATTKAALIGFTKGLAADLVEEKIRVNAILPGYIRTPMVENMAQLSNPKNPESVIEGIEQAIPMKRMGTVQELGELAAFLASQESSYITAQEFVIDGGSTLPETMTMGV